MKKAIFEHIGMTERILWGSVLVTLPVTSFRYLPFMGSGTQVKPLAFLPAALLVCVLIIHSLYERRLLLWNAGFQPLLLFILIAGITSAIGYFYTPVDLFSASYSGRMIRAWVSLGVGLVFLVTSMAMNRDETDLRFTLKWLYIGFGVDIGWSIVQLAEIYIFHTNIIDMIQKTVMMAGLPPNKRISGLALEPSWLAAQVITLYLPWAFAAMFSRHGWEKKRWIPIVILAGCAFLLLFTFSRSGILSAVGVIGLTAVVAGREEIKKGWIWFITPLQSKYKSDRRLLETGIRIVTIFAILAGIAGGLFVLSRNHYFAAIWQSEAKSLPEYFVSIYAGPRLAYSVAGWSIFEHHPWTGVGLGATGFYLYQYLPDWALFKNPEIAQYLSPAHEIFPNTKNLFMRLLSETGIFGFWAFISMYAFMFAKILELLKIKQKNMAFLGTASFMAWIAIMVVNLTQDSVAMANIWIPIGILAGMTAFRKPREEATSTLQSQNFGSSQVHKLQAS